MSVLNIVATYQQLVPNLPLATPLSVRNGNRVIGTLDIKSNSAWRGFFEAIQAAANRNLIVTADIDFGTVNAGSHKTEIVPTAIASFLPVAPLPVVDSFIVPIYPAGSAGLIFTAQMEAIGKFRVLANNFTAFAITPGSLAMEFLIVPRL